MPEKIRVVSFARQQAGVTFVDPAEIFRGAIVVLAPHMDDEILACGGTLARIPDKSRIHLIYATDGSRSPAPAAPWLKAPIGLSEIRMRESREALRVLGVAGKNLRFLGFPDGRLQTHAAEFEETITPLLDAIDPAHVLAPFRYDRHPDHVAVNRFATTWIAGRNGGSELMEYFVYYRSRLLARGDIRAYIRPTHLLAVDIRGQSDTKRRALDCFESQTTRLFEFQHRPNLSPSLLDEVCRDPELFLRYSGSAVGSAIFEGPTTWIRLAHRLEPILKERKDRIVGLLGCLTP